MNIYVCDKDYKRFDCLDCIKYGDRIKISHSVHGVNVDISDLAKEDISKLKKMREESTNKEQQVFDFISAALKEWEQHAVQTQTIDIALDYLHTPEVEHTSNQWQEENFHEVISNRVYKMYYYVREESKYDIEKKKSIPKAWYVTWRIFINNPLDEIKQIAGQFNKRYTDKEKAIKYLEGRKKAYAHLFTDINPPVPKEYAHLFSINGLLLPGYTLEEQEKSDREEIQNDK